MKTEPVQRNYQVVDLSARGTVVIEVDFQEPEDTGETAAQWVGNRAALRPGGFFDYFNEGEKVILRRGLHR